MLPLARPTLPNATAVTRRRAYVAGITIASAAVAAMFCAALATAPLTMS